VLVKCCGLKSSWVSNSGKYGVIRFSTSRSMTLITVLSSVMGLYEVTSIRSFFVGFEDSDNDTVFHCR